MKIFLDDIRFPPAEPGWSICRNLDDFYFTWGKNRDRVTDIAFDHDLGSEDTGFDALALVEHDILIGLPVHPDLTMTVHSMNLEEAKKMREVIKRLEVKISCIK